MKKKKILFLITVAKTIPETLKLKHKFKEWVGNILIFLLLTTSIENFIYLF